MTSAAPRAHQIRPLAASIGAIVGCIVAFVGANLLGLVVMFAILDPSVLSSPAGLEEKLMDVAATLPVVGSTVLVSHGTLIIVPFVVAALVKADPKKALGLKSAPWPTYVLASIAALALGPTSDAMVHLAEQALPDFSLGNLDMIEKLVQSVSAFALWPFVALLPAIGEELMFRGLVQRSFGFGVRAITISAISFSFFHLDPHHVAGVLPLGFFIAWVAARTDSTLVPMVVHLVNNSVAIFAAQSDTLAVGHGTETPMPLWFMPVGWLVALPCVWGIVRYTKNMRRDAQPSHEMPKPMLSPDIASVSVPAPEISTAPSSGTARNSTSIGNPLARANADAASAAGESTPSPDPAPEE